MCVCSLLLTVPLLHLSLWHVMCSQADETKIGCLTIEMTRLLRKLLVKFVQMRHVKDKADVRDVDYTNPELHHDNEFMAVGLPARTLLADTDAAIANQRRQSFSGELYICLFGLYVQCVKLTVRNYAA